MSKELIIQKCDRAITNLRRAIGYASNLPSEEYQLKECLESSLLGAQEQLKEALESFYNWDCVTAKNEKQEEYF